MGIGLTVGILADMLQSRAEGEDGYDDYAAEFEQISVALASRGVAPHHEPTSCEVRGWDLSSAGGLHSLRRIAAYLDLYDRLPDADCDSPSRDEVLASYSTTAKRSPRTFDHLIMHSDCGGYYVPERFKTPIYETDELAVPGWALGSAPMLLEECSRIASAIDLPDVEASIIAEAIYRPSLSALPDGAWLRFPRASYVCRCFVEATRYSIATGAAILID